MSKKITLMPRLLQCKPQYSINPDTGDKPEVILWFQNLTSGIVTLPFLVTIASKFDPLWKLTHTNLGPTTKAYTGSVWTDFSTAFGLSYTSVGSFTAVNGTSGNALPPQVAALVSYSNGERYKGGHFRTYLPWVGTGSLSATDSALLNSTTVTNVTSAVNGMQSGMIASGVLGGQQQVLFRHRYDPVNARLDPVITMQCQQLLATQRRRLRKPPHT